MRHRGETEAENVKESEVKVRESHREATYQLLTGPT